MIIIVYSDDGICHESIDHCSVHAHSILKFNFRGKDFSAHQVFMACFHWLRYFSFNTCWLLACFLSINVYDLLNFTFIGLIIWCILVFPGQNNNNENNVLALFRVIEFNVGTECFSVWNPMILCRASAWVKVLKSYLLESLREALQTTYISLLLPCSPLENSFCRGLPLIYPYRYWIEKKC